MLGCECERFGAPPYTLSHLLITLVAVAPPEKEKLPVARFTSTVYVRL